MEARAKCQWDAGKPNEFGHLLPVHGIYRIGLSLRVRRIEDRVACAETFRAHLVAGKGQPGDCYSYSWRVAQVFDPTMEFSSVGGRCQTCGRDSFLLATCNLCGLRYCDSCGHLSSDCARSTDGGRGTSRTSAGRTQDVPCVVCGRRCLPAPCGRCGAHVCTSHVQLEQHECPSLSRGQLEKDRIWESELRRVRGERVEHTRENVRRWGGIATTSIRMKAPVARTRSRIRARRERPARALDPRTEALLEKRRAAKEKRLAKAAARAKARAENKAAAAAAAAAAVDAHRAGDAGGVELRMPSRPELYNRGHELYRLSLSDENSSA